MSDTEYAATRALLQGIVDDGYVQIDHSWRCDHPEIYGACDCEEVAVRALHGALAAHDAELTKRVKVEQAETDAQIGHDAAAQWVDEWQPNSHKNSHIEDYVLAEIRDAVGLSPQQ